MTTTLPIVGLPKRLANLETARQKYGYKVDFMIEMLQVGDPLADAVISEINELGKVARQQLNKGLVDGLASLDNPPPAIAAFVADRLSAAEPAARGV
jgi:hypothetical protein